MKDASSNRRPKSEFHSRSTQKVSSEPQNS